MQYDVYLYIFRVVYCLLIICTNIHKSSRLRIMRTCACACEASIKSFGGRRRRCNLIGL